MSNVRCSCVKFFSSVVEWVLLLPFHFVYVFCVLLCFEALCNGGNSFDYQCCRICDDMCVMNEITNFTVNGGTVILQ